MQLGCVLGTIVSTQKERSLVGVKFLLVQLLNQEGHPLPVYEVAADGVGAGIDEWVLISRGSAARQPDGNQTRPLDAVVIAIVDTVTLGNQRIYRKDRLLN